MLMHPFSRTNMRWLAGTCLIAFAFLRLPYFLMTDIALLQVSTDAIWWAEIQHWFLRDSAGLNAEMLQRRIHFRLPTDIALQRFVVEASRFLRLGLIPTNLLITSAIFLAAVAFIFRLGVKVLQSAPWASAFTLSIMLTAYAGWLRYPILVPKILGFMLFPLILLSLLELIEKDKGYIRAGSVILLSMALYYVSVMYTLPAMALATFLLGLHYRKSDNDRLLLFFIRQTVFWLTILALSLVALFWLKGGTAGLTPPRLDITEFVSHAHRYLLSDFIDDLKTHGFSAAAILLGWHLIGKAGDSDRARRQFVWCAWVFAILIIIAVFSHLYASDIGLLRTTYYWRAGYYTYIPVGLCFFLALKHTPAAHKVKGLAIIAFIIAAIAGKSISYFPIRSLPQIISPAYLPTAKEEERHIQSLIEYARTLPKNSLIMMPPFHYQNSSTDIFEIFATVPTVFSRKDTGDFLLQTPHTQSMYRAYTAYADAMRIKDVATRTRTVYKLAVENHATHILIRKARGVTLSDNSLHNVFENDDWMLLAIGDKK